MQVFVADSLTKVFAEPEGGERPLRMPPLRMSAARNERESGQIVVVAEGPELYGVRLTVFDLESVEGKGRIPAQCISVNPVGYVETLQPGYEVDRTGWWPDPLMPLKPAQIQAGRRQPFWITVHVPELGPPGLCRGSIIVSAEGTRDVEVPLELRVWDFALAPVPRCASAISINPRHLARFYNELPLSEETLRNYWEMLFSHRLSSDDVGDAFEQGMDAVIAGGAKPPFDYTALGRRLSYCFDRGLTVFKAATLPGFLGDGPDLTEEEQDRIVTYLRDLAAWLRQQGWLEQACVPVWDEPEDQCAPQVLKQLQLIHLADARLRTRLDGPVTGPLVDLCESEVDVWATHMRRMAEGEDQARENVARRRAEGDSIWLYIACDTQHPYPNVFIDYPLIDCRIFPWLAWKYHADCLAYWTATGFGERNFQGDSPLEKWPNRPWVSANFVETWDGRQTPYNGDGHLIYPGPDGTALPSVRLEALRDGMEDWEYLTLLEEGAEALKLADVEPELVTEAHTWLEQQRIVRSFTEWCHNPDELLARRNELAELLERVCRAASPVGESGAHAVRQG